MATHSEKERTNKIKKIVKAIYEKKPSSSSIAKSMMERLGWNGKGLGKYEQGIINPLLMKKLGTRGGGKIINDNPDYDPDLYYKGSKIQTQLSSFSNKLCF